MKEEFRNSCKLVENFVLIKFTELLANKKMLSIICKLPPLQTTGNMSS